MAFSNVTNIGNIVTIIGNIVKRCFLISLDFLLFSFCICKLGVFLVVFGVFLTKKKHRFSASLVQLLENCFSVFTRQIHSFLVTHPLLAWGWGQKIGQICGVFSSKDSKNAHFLTFFERLHPPNNFKNKKQDLGALPQTPSHLRGRRGRWQTLSTYPYGECWVDSRRQG